MYAKRMDKSCIYRWSLTDHVYFWHNHSNTASCSIPSLRIHEYVAQRFPVFYVQRIWRFWQRYLHGSFLFRRRFLIGDVGVNFSHVVIFVTFDLSLWRWRARQHWLNVVCKCPKVGSLTRAAVPTRLHHSEPATTTTTMDKCITKTRFSSWQLIL